MSVYVRGVELGTAQIPLNRRFIHIGSVSDSEPRFVIYSDSLGESDYSVFSSKDDSSSAFASSGVAPVIESRIEVLGTLSQDGSVSVQMSENGIDSALSVDSNIYGLPESWSDDILTISGSFGSADKHPFIAIRDIIIARGVRDLDWFRNRIAP
jgi:hypothetical protein